MADRVDACVVVDAAFRALLAQDPRLGEQLAVLAKSPPLIFSILCTSNRADPDLIKDISEAILELPHFPEGRELLRVFGVNDHIPFRDEYLVGIRQLLAAKKRRLPVPRQTD
jgi:ABC-type phosphate/phosphonate transport system substrate-binding protein